MKMKLPRLRPDQAEIAKHPAKYKVLSMGRRWGKTVMAGTIALANSAMGGKVAWVVPTFRNSRPVWRFAEAHALGIARINKSEMSMTFPGSGSLGVYTAENPVGILGEDFDLVIIDEAARIPPDVWQETIMPTLADRDGLAFLISTPKAKNWFYEEFMRGLADGKQQASFTAPSSANPSPQIRRAAEMARERVSERTYRQEWLAEFVDDGTLFVNVEACATAQPAAYEQGHTYAIGVDWARASGGDYTVFVVIDATTRTMAQMVRMSGTAFDTQLARLRALWASYGRPAILAEYNSLGGPLVERLQTDGLPVTGFTTTASTKHEIITALELAFDRQDIRVLNDPVLLQELNAYERKERAGLPGYSAPSGMHDDTVIALALAYWQCQRGGWLW
jgi:hypothetical protein